MLHSSRRDRQKNIEYGFQSPEHLCFGDFVYFLYKMPVRYLLENEYNISKKFG